MKSHTKIYMKALGYSDTDFVPSEISGKKAVDICHLIPRGAGGNPDKSLDRIENLMAQTREEHIQLGDKRHTTAEQFRKHRDFLGLNGVSFDYAWMDAQIAKYEVYEMDAV
ncbi:HNH endonuclease [Leeuwenhoekiella sp. MAR_2009_132]|uniref:HNH endonuclease n=1 Tax=Leeuwenhoekiella sp. MAR_2009_132 TaxID=1392489 RepID=UPI0004908FF3|nr:HNH endonuclease [Leeuwenhoekiella sp. MAR_2009_132]